AGGGGGRAPGAPGGRPPPRNTGGGNPKGFPSRKLKYRSSREPGALMSTADRPPDEVPVVRRYEPPPRPPFPGFGWALLWCLAFLALTQVPAGFVAVLPLLVRALRHEPVPAGMPALLADPDLSAGLAWGLAVRNLLGILGSWGVLRARARRGWKRAVALRRPDLLHLGLVVLLWPAFSVLGEGLARLVGPYLPSLGDLFAEGPGGSGRKFLDEFNQVIGGWPWWVGVLVV